MASLIIASDDRTVFSRSLVSRRQRPSQANVRSTVQRISSTTQPLTPAGRRTTSTVRGTLFSTHSYMA